MATQDELHQAFIDWLTSYLLETDTGTEDAKIIEIASKYLDKKEYSAAASPVPGSFEEGALDKIRKQHGVGEDSE